MRNDWGDEAKTPKRKRRTDLGNCPGFWYGTDPYHNTHDLDRGSAVIDPSELVEALPWLKRRYRILAVGLHCGNSIRFTIARK